MSGRCVCVCECACASLCLSVSVFVSLGSRTWVCLFLGFVPVLGRTIWSDPSGSVSSFGLSLLVCPCLRCRVRAFTLA
jgi:hypothetical protein